MKLQERIELMIALGDYLQDNPEEWNEIKLQAYQKNPWFTTSFIDIASNNIVQDFLQKTKLEKWTQQYFLDDNITGKNVGIVMAGNLPMVGFHDFLSVFISGHRQTIKFSSKDDVLLNFLIRKLNTLHPDFKNHVAIGEMLKGCDAYIATGSNNSSRYFEQYFAPFPHIIRRNKTSVAVLTGDEDTFELEKLSDDIHLYFGLGCRNVTKLFVPQAYDFVPLIRSFDKYHYFMDQHKYKNNYDYQFSIILLNKIYYMTNGNTILIENHQSFSPISVIHYEYYESNGIRSKFKEYQGDIQCTIGKEFLPFGEAQSPGLTSYADSIDTMAFLLSF